MVTLANSGDPDEMVGLHFVVKAKENQDKVPTLYWLPKLHKKNL